LRKGKGASGPLQRLSSPRKKRKEWLAPTGEVNRRFNGKTRGRTARKEFETGGGGGGGVYQIITLRDLKEN